jgi:hypothetical protein
MWQDGDLVINLEGCRGSDKRDCEAEMRHYFSIWETEVEKLDGKRLEYHIGPPKPHKDPMKADKSKAGAAGV